jgi:antimicrobial peptide system SdpA family protein
MIRTCYILVYACWSAFVIFVLANSLPFNPVSIMNYKREMAVKSVVPEGWGFFTRSPREADIIIFQQRNGAWSKNEKTPLAKASNIFGLDRKPRAQATEMAMLLQKLKPSDWIHCEENFLECMKDSNNGFITLENTVPNAVLRDTICFINRKPLPWAWHNIATVDQLPSSFVKIVISCSGKK